MEQKVKPCPNCDASDAEKMNFTWWGGAIGPRLLNHVKCNMCGTAYNSKTGQSNTMFIMLYSVVVFIIVIGIYMVIYPT